MIHNCIMMATITSLLEKVSSTPLFMAGLDITIIAGGPCQLKVTYSSFKSLLFKTNLKRANHLYPIFTFLIFCPLLKIIILFLDVFRQVRMVKHPSDLVQEVYLRTRNDEKLVIPLNFSSFRNALKANFLKFLF